ncbi:MAG: nucleosidase [Candidatus Nanopelagicales bacterium]
MRLHRTISSDRPLLVVALEEEATHLHVSDLPVLVTGVGKVNAAIAVALTLADASPSAVVNLGTAGALRDDVAGTHVIGTVVQHDLDDDALFGLTGMRFGEPVRLADAGLTLATGDVFVSDPATRERLARTADLVDMEGYAVALAARAAGVPVTLVKQVSDRAGDSAARTWKQNVDECAERLGDWVRAELLG